MGWKPIIKWSCDVCPNTFETPSEAQPHNWSTVVIVVPPKKNPGEAENRTVLCPDCTRRVLTAINPPQEA